MQIPDVLKKELKAGNSNSNGMVRRASKTKGRKTVRQVRIVLTAYSSSSSSLDIDCSDGSMGWVQPLLSVLHPSLKEILDPSLDCPQDLLLVSPLVIDEAKTRDTIADYVPV